MALISAEIDPRQLARVRKRYERYRGKPLQDRIRFATLKIADMLRKPIQAETPVGPTGNLRKSVRARQAKQRVGGSLVKTFGSLVGPTDAKRHLIIRGHRIVTPGGRYTGRSTRPNPFVDRAVAPRIDDVVREVSKIVFGP